MKMATCQPHNAKDLAGDVIRHLQRGPGKTPDKVHSSYPAPLPLAIRDVTGGSRAPMKVSKSQPKPRPKLKFQQTNAARTATNDFFGERPLHLQSTPPNLQNLDPDQRPWFWKELTPRKPYSAPSQADWDRVARAQQDVIAPRDIQAELEEPWNWMEEQDRQMYEHYRLGIKYGLCDPDDRWSVKDWMDNRRPRPEIYRYMIRGSFQLWWEKRAIIDAWMEYENNPETQFPIRAFKELRVPKPKDEEYRLAPRDVLEPDLLATASSDGVIILMVTIIGFFIGSGVTLMVFRFHHSSANWLLHRQQSPLHPNQT